MFIEKLSEHIVYMYHMNHIVCVYYNWTLGETLLNIQIKSFRFVPQRAMLVRVAAMPTINTLENRNELNPLPENVIKDVANLRIWSLMVRS